MPNYKYLIVGGGMTAAAAVKGIRDVDATGSIGIITSEPHPPYSRPPLSKGLWKGDPVEKIWRTMPADGLTIHTSTVANVLQLQNKKVTDDKGAEYSFGKLLLATGGAVRRLPYNVDGIIYYRTFDDYQQLRALTAKGETFVVIGGGFIGSEVAAALAMNNKKTIMILPEPGIGAKVYPARLSAFLNRHYASKGVEVLSKNNVAGIDKRGTTYIVNLAGGKELSADGIVAGIGIVPNTGLAQDAGLKVENGIQVDEWLRTSHADVYAAGDVANFFSFVLGKRIRVEHEDNANTMGETAGKNMAGSATPYRHIPSFYSDLFDIGYEAVGELDARLETVEDWKESAEGGREGVIYYLEHSRVRGVLLWNTWEQVDHARTLIAEKGPFTAQNLKGRLPAK
jgi:NADPH-dependent 2,4-dienoyl-CoA reductase/sulfur reductase-like enzyme